MSKPWLSVLMPVYNGEKYLQASLDSVLSQDDPEVECIAVDDGSTDSSLAILDAYSARMPMRVLRQKHTGNWAANTNAALSLAQADYACILHQDDLWLGGRLRVMKDLISRYPESNLLLNPSLYVDEKGNRIGLLRSPLPSVPAMIDADTMMQRLLVQNFISIVAPIFKREIALRIGGLDGNMWYAPDWDFWLKMALCGKILYYPKPLSAFRIHRQAQTIISGVDTDKFKRELETVLERNMRAWAAPDAVKNSVFKIASFSNEMNTALALIYYRKKADIFWLFFSFLKLTPNGWHRYLRDSRILERISARLRLIWR